LSPGTATISVGGQALLLLPDKAAFLPGSATLLVADAHIGKAQSFRKLGVPVPHGTTQETLDALSALVRRLNARSIVFLGDFLHSAHSLGPTTLDAVVRWREAHAALELTLVRGNHDDHAGDPPAHLGIAAVDEPLLHGGLALCHHPIARPPAYVLAGHLHPGVSMGGRAYDSLRLPCFWFGPNVGVLPAFGAFTGTHTIRAGQDERVFAAIDGRVIELGPTSN
jgi:DNA ligase-associated metallophosphoesterase